MMKGTVINQKSLNQKFIKACNIKFNSRIPRSVKMDIKELLARMWIKCDPNRGGTDPDCLIENEGNSNYNGKPEWTWYVPRAEATLKFLDDAGYKIVRK